MRYLRQLVVVGAWVVVAPLSGQVVDGTATIRYDPGGPGHWNAGIPGPVVGNLFNSQLGSPLTSGTIYWAWAHAFGDYGVGDLFVAGPVVGGSAPYIARIDLGDGPSGYSASFSPISVPGSFLVGFRANLANQIWVASGTYQGQGVHGRYWTGGFSGLPATSIQTMPPPPPHTLLGLNFAIRVRGNVAAVPVELMEFQVE